MGNRASVSFKQDDWESVTVFSHWGGKQFQKDAQAFVDELKTELRLHPERYNGLPLGRLEPQTVVLDFLRWYLKDHDGRIGSNLYLGKDRQDGDNSDNGHRVIKLGRVL